MSNTILQISDYLNMYRYHHHIPGLVVSVFKGDHVIFQQGYGRTSLNKGGSIIKPDTCFSIQHITEIFTSCALLHLQETTDFRLDDPVSHYLPYFQKTITTRQLLSHTAGFPDDRWLTSLLDEEFVAFTKDMPEYRMVYQQLPQMKKTLSSIQTREDVSKYIAKIDLVNEPGQVWKYFPDGYMIAADVLEKLSGMTYEAYVQTYILQPLQLTQTYMNFPNHIKEKGVSYYLHTTGEPMPVPRPNNKIGIPMGFIYSSANDLTTLFMEIMQPTGKVISKDSIREMFRPMIGGKGTKNNGLGWQINGQILEQIGSYPGVSSYGAINQEQSLGIVLLCNMDHITLKNAAKKIMNVFTKI